MSALRMLCVPLAGGMAFLGAYGLVGELSVRELQALVADVDARLQALMPASKVRAQDRRRAQVLTQMPTFLDIVTLGLGAGLSFDASLELYCTRYENELSVAVSNAMLSWRMGYQSRGEALEALATEIDAAALHRFAATVSEALAFGTPLSEALTQQARVIRDEQRAEREEEIERAPVKMLIPLGTLIVPAMLLAILGPLLGPVLAGG
ncbi:MAG: type II secretion system F family protein [Coriobacteriales bacterium]|nr:type II secretion system F family protein [Coriobacteriales bacterium]